MTIHIRPLTAEDSLDHLTDLLHRAYRQLADMGLRYLASHQDVAMTRRRTESGTCLLAEHNGEIVGTVTVYPPESVSGSPWLNRVDVGEIGQLAVEPEIQGRGVGTRLVKEAEILALKLGVHELALDTSEKAGHLIAWYERLGYRYIEQVDWEVTNYVSIVMSKRLLDTTKDDKALRSLDESSENPGGRS